LSAQGYPDSAGEPPKLLRAFEKVFLQPGETATVQMVLDARASSVWSVVAQAWEPVHGEFAVYVGASAGDVRLKGTTVL
jgi:beta-glucosidase